MAMNVPAQNADDVAEFVFAVVLNSAMNSFDGDPWDDHRRSVAR